MTKKNVGVWTAVNRNGNIVSFTECPEKNTETGKWEAKHPFVNSVFYNQIKDLIVKANMTWESEPEYFEIQF